jgi:diacylglycerol O-acyltransferase-1
LTEVEPKQATTLEKLQTTTQRKYRHVAAVHSKVRPSCLSQDSDAPTSFIGFRNLMVIVLGKQPPL